MRRILFLFCTASALFLCCTPSPKETPVSNLQPSSNEMPLANNLSSADEPSGGYEDGDYCATIQYYNSSTGNSSTYTLDVEVENGELVQINWSNGGWLDNSHFSPPEVDSDGSCSFSTYDGKNYDVQIDDEGGCSVSSSSPEEEENQIEEPELQTQDEEVEETSLFHIRMNHSQLPMISDITSTESTFS